MDKKYELTDETIKLENGRILFRIKALCDFGDVKKGDIGGYIETEENLLHIGKCWVYGYARVYGNAKVCGNAWVCDNAKVYGNAWVCDNAKVYSNARVCGDALVYSDAQVYGNAWVGDNAKVFDKARVCGDALVYGDAQVYNNARVTDNTEVHGYAQVYGHACVYENAKVFDNGQVYDSAGVRGVIGYNAIVRSSKDYFIIGPIGSRNAITTFYKTSDSIGVCCGCFNGTIEQFENKVKETHSGTKHELDYIAAITFAKTKLY